MKLSCQASPKHSTIRRQLVARLLALGFEPQEEGDRIVVDYEGAFDGKAMALISVFETFGCDRALIFTEMGGESNEGSQKEGETLIAIRLGKSKPCWQN